MQTAGHRLAALRDDQALHVIEKVFALRVERRCPDVVSRYGIEREANGVGIGGRNDPLPGEHHQARIVNRHQGAEKEGFSVLKILAEHAFDVFGMEKRHYIGPRPGTRRNKRFINVTNRRGCRVE